MNLEDVNIKDIKPTEVSNIVSKLESEEEKEKFKERYSKMIEERWEKEPEPEIIKDEWKCLICGGTFEVERGKEPLECKGICGKSANKTQFEALEGPYQYFDFSGRKRFIPRLLAQDILEDYYFATMESTKDIYVFDKNYYRSKGENIINKESQERLLNESIKNRKEEVLNWIQTDTLTPSSEFDKDPYLIALKNGVFNLKEDKLEEGDPEKITTTKIPVEYDPQAEFEGSNIESFLNDILYKEDIPVIQEYIGYTLFKRYSYKKGLMLLGPTNTGKSVLLELIEELLGNENTSNQSLKELADYKFARANLYGKLANISGDLSPNKIFDIGIYKMLTGSDTINLPIKHKQEQLQFENYAKMLFSCNRLPDVHNPDDAWWERWIILKCENQFNPDDPDTIPKHKLMSKMTTQEELSALLNWVIEGLNRLMEQGHFTQSKYGEEIEDIWIRQTDSLKAFVKDYCVEDPNGRIVKKDFYNAYTSYCNEEGLDSIHQKEVGRKLPQAVSYVNSRKPKVKWQDSNRQMWVWEGIKFKEESEYSQYNRKIDKFKGFGSDDKDHDNEEDHDIITEKEIYDQADDDKEIFLPDLSEELDKTPSEVKPKLESMVYQGKLVKVKEGVYRLA